MKSAVLFVFALILSFQLCAANEPPTPSPYQYKADLAIEYGPRFLGSENIGNTRGYGLFFYTSDPATHYSPLALEFEQHENMVDPSSDIVLLKKRFALGTNFRANDHIGFRVGVSHQTFLNDDDFWSSGIYPYYNGAGSNVELGFEDDHTGRFYSALQYTKNVGSGTLLAGVSEEKYQEQRATVIHFQQERIGGGYLADFTSQRFQVLASGNYNVDTQKPTWTLGLSRYAALDRNGLNPALTLTYRIKPESWYGLGIFTLGGHAINRYACQEIQKAFFSGSFTHSRLVGNRNYDTPLIGSSYEAKDFGTLVVAVSVLSVNAGATAKLISRDVSWYATYPHAFGVLRDPYVGLTWNEFSDLVYDPEAHQLLDPQQRFWEFKAGWKIRLHERKDRRNQLGQLRLSLVANTHGGWSAKTTTWF